MGVYNRKSASHFLQSYTLPMMDPVSAPAAFKIPVVFYGIIRQCTHISLADISRPESPSLIMGYFSTLRISGFAMFITEVEASLLYTHISNHFLLRQWESLGWAWLVILGGFDGKLAQQ